MLADLFASVEAAAKQQTGNKKVEELEKLVAKLEKFESQREAEIRHKDLTINELKTQLGDVAQVSQMKAALEAAQREAAQLKKEAEDAAAHIKTLEQRQAHTPGGEHGTFGGGAAPAAAGVATSGEENANAGAATGGGSAPPPPMHPKMPPPPKGLKLKPKPAAAAPSEGAGAEEKPAGGADATAATTDTNAGASEAAAVVTGGPPPPPPPKLKGGPLPPPPPKLKAKGGLPPPPTAAPTDGATLDGAAATGTEGEAASAAPSTGGPPPPPPMKGGPPPPPMKGGPPPPPGKGGPPPPPGGKKGAAVAVAAAAPPIPPKKRPPPPTVKMKGITWNKVPPNKLAQTVWAKTSDFEVPIDQKNLEDLFGAAVVETKKADDGSKKKKKEPVSLIDGKRAQNLNILLGSKLGKLTFDDIKKAILTLDDTVLVPEVTKALLGFVPTEEEVRSTRMDFFFIKILKKITLLLYFPIYVFLLFPQLS